MVYFFLKAMREKYMEKKILCKNFGFFNDCFFWQKINNQKKEEHMQDGGYCELNHNLIMYELV
jgi:hypothetical protein